MACTLTLVIGLNYAPKTSIKAWARLVFVVVSAKCESVRKPIAFVGKRQPQDWKQSQNLLYLVTAMLKRKNKWNTRKWKLEKFPVW